MLCTQLDVEQKLQWDVTAEPDGTVTALIADAQSHIEAEVGRTLESAERTEILDGGRVTYYLHWWPVTSITSVTEDGTVLTADEFRASPSGRLIRTSAAGYQILWQTRKLDSIVVEYDGGFLAGEPDHDMALEHLGSLCAEVVARAFRLGATNAALPAGAAGGVQSVALDGSDSVTYSTGGSGTGVLAGGLGRFIFLEEDERRQLSRYKGLPGFA